MTSKSIITGAILLCLFNNVFLENISEISEYQSQNVTQEDLQLLGRYDCSAYYKGSVTTTWPSAKDVCRNSLGPKATLVSVETVEELQRLRIMLDDDLVGALNFWVNGQWNGCYMWMNTAQCVDEAKVVHWFGARPDGDVTLRLLLVYQGKNVDLTFTAVVLFNTEKFICEVPIEGPNC